MRKLSFVFAALLVVMSGCRRTEEQAFEHRDEAANRLTASERKSDPVEAPTEKSNNHVILSQWYLHQYSAVEILNKIGGERLETGSKLAESPEDILGKQLEFIKSLNENQLGSDEIEKWLELQAKLVAALYSKIDREVDVESDGATNDKRAEKLVQLQIVILPKFE